MHGRYRVVEQIEKADSGFDVRVTAFDDQAAREMPWKPVEVIRFSARYTAPTLQDARRALQTLVGVMRSDIARDLPMK